MIEVYTLRPTGDIDIETVEDLRSSWLRLIDALKPRRLVIDLGQVAFVDSIALALFVVASKHQRKHQGVLTLVNVPAAARQLLAITEIDHFVDVREPDGSPVIE